MNILCICTYYKGVEFMRAAHAEGNAVYLVTHKKLEHKAWPREALEDIFYLEEVDNNFNTYQTLIEGLAHLFRTKQMDVVVALDDFDVEKAALVREHFRIAGMGQTTARYFRDKLAMRIQAQDKGINVPKFSALFSDIAITEYLQTTASPWVIKPRSEASAAGIKKVHSFDEAWQAIHLLGSQRHNYLIEEFKPGDVFHIDALTVGGKVVFARCSQYLNTPFEVAHGGGIFRSVTVAFGSEEEKQLLAMNKAVMQAFGMQFSASHTEVIKCYEDGKYYFLETASRVGGANLAEMVEASSGINLWREWAKIETAVAAGHAYQVPKPTKRYSGIIISLSSHQHPDLTPFADPEVCWRMDEPHHLGLIVQADNRNRVLELMDAYAHRIHQLGYHASAPAPDKPTH